MSSQSVLCIPDLQVGSGKDLILYGGSVDDLMRDGRIIFGKGRTNRERRMPGHFTAATPNQEDQNLSVVKEGRRHCQLQK